MPWLTHRSSYENEFDSCHFHVVFLLLGTVYVLIFVTVRQAVNCTLSFVLYVRPSAVNLLCLFYVFS